MRKRQKQHNKSAERHRAEDDSLDEDDEEYVEVEFETAQDRSSGGTIRRSKRLAAVDTSKPITSLSDPASQQLDRARRISKVLISIDFGTQATKAVYMTLGKSDKEVPRLLHNKNIIQRIERVTWPGGVCECPTQLAILNNDDGTETILWGQEVDTALENNDIRETDVLRGMKASVFGGRQNKATSYYLERLNSRIAQLPPPPKLEDGNGVQPWDPYRIWVMFLRKAFGYVLFKIKTAEGSELPWPSPTDDQDYSSMFELSDYRDCAVEIALPVPAGLAVEYCQLALEAAKEAGLPNCYLVAEPASVAAVVAQEDYEQQPNSYDSRPMLFVDNGCGTVDLTLTSISTTEEDSGSYKGSICLREEIPGIMRWCGGDINNKEFRDVVVNEADLDQIVHDINSAGAAVLPFTRETLLDYLDREFESKKKRFNGKKQISILLPHGSRQQIRNSFELVNNLLTMPPGTVQKIFSNTLKEIVELIDNQLAAFHERRPHEERDKHTVKRIVLAGGGNENAYVAQFLVDRYCHGQCNAKERYTKPKFKVEVIKPASSSKALMMTVRGALLLLLDRPFVGKRVARRAYCFAWDEEPVDGRDYDDGQIQHNEMLGADMAQDAAKFILSIGDVIEGKFRRSIHGTRGLWLDENDGDGWEVEEVLWYTDKIENCKDGRWVRLDKHGFGEAGILRLKLTPENASLFEVRTADCGRQYKYLEYELVMSIENYTTNFEFNIPCSGNFKVNKGSIKRSAILDCGHIFATYTTSNANRKY